MRGVQPTLAHGFGNTCELLRRVLGNRLAGLSRTQFFRVEKYCLQDFETARLSELVERDFVRGGNRLGEIRVNDDPVEIADDKKRRTGQRIAI